MGWTVYVSFQSLRGWQPGVPDGVGDSSPFKPGIDTDRSSVVVGVMVGVADGIGVSVGGSKVGGGSSVRDGVSEGSGVEGGIVSVAVAAF